jgi:hypothetical protein
MFTVFQIESNREYQATIGLSYEAALAILCELQRYNPETVFVIRQAP